MGDHALQIRLGANRWCRISFEGATHERLRPARLRTGERGRRSNLRRARRRDPRHRRIAARLSHQAHPDPARTAGRLHGGHPRAADRPAGRLPRDPRSRGAQSDHRRRLCAPGRNADGHDHRAEGHHEPQAGKVSGRGHRRDDDTPNQDGAPDRQCGDHSLDRARRLSLGAAGTARASSSGTAGRRCRRKSAERSAHQAAPD